MTSLVLLAAAVLTGLVNPHSGHSLTGTVFITTTVVPMTGGPSDAAAADGDAVFMGLGASIVHLDRNVQPPAAVPVADLDADVAALAVDSARVWAGDVLGRLYAFERRPDGALAAAGSLDVGTGGGAPKVVAKIVIDGPRAFVTMVETGLVIVDAVDGDLRVRGRIDQWDLAPSIGVLDGAVYAVIGPALTRIDVHGGGEIERDTVTLAFDPDVYHNGLFWGPHLLAVDAVRRQLVTVGGVYSWAGRPCECMAFAFDLLSPLAPRETAHGYPNYIAPKQLALGPDWAYLVSDDHFAAEQRRRWTLTALNRGRDRFGAQLWWQGTEAIGAPAPLPDGGVVLPMHTGGYILLEPHVAGRVWLPVGWR